MKKALLRLTLITVLTLVWCSLALLGIRKLGLKDQYAELDHPLLKTDFWQIVYSDQKKSWDEALKMAPQSIVGAPIQALKDSTLVVSEKPLILRGKTVVHLGLIDLHQWKELVPDGLSLAEFLDAYPNSTLYLDIERLNTLNLRQLSLELKELTNSSRVLLGPAHQGLKKKLKEQSPWWLFANTVAEMGKFKLMGSLGIETVTQLDADYFIDTGFDETLLKEIRRRRKKAILKALDQPPPTNPELYDGLITRHPIPH